MSSSRLICTTCKRSYRLKEQGFSSELLCFHCGSVLRSLEASERVEPKITQTTPQRVGFNTLLNKMSRDIPTEEFRLIEEMHREGAVDTGWLKRNYEKGAGETRETELEVIEEFNPLVFSNYQALYAVAEGAEGIVYKGWKTGGKEIVAIKRLHPDKVADPTSRERFFRELRFLKSLSHPNILKLLDGGEKNGDYFLITPFIEDSLKDRMNALPPGRKIEDIAPLLVIVIQIGKALQCAHEHGLVHRDVKPANILLSGDHPYLADFGLARQMEMESDSPKLTRGAVGTPCYMAPELWEQKASPQVDIYALGVILYEILAGCYPFPGNTPAQILASQLNSPPVPPITKDSPFPKELNQLVLKALARYPDDRHTTAKEFARALTLILGKEPGW